MVDTNGEDGWSWGFNIENLVETSGLTVKAYQGSTPVATWNGTIHAIELPAWLDDSRGLADVDMKFDRDTYYFDATYTFWDYTLDAPNLPMPYLGDRFIGWQSGLDISFSSALSGETTDPEVVGFTRGAALGYELFAHQFELTEEHSIGFANGPTFRAKTSSASRPPTCGLTRVRR